MGTTRVLFFAEAVTLAHVARPLALAKGLDPARHEIVMACDSRYLRFLEREPWQTLPLQSISSAQFLQALAKGSAVYDTETLRRYVKEDIALIERVKPDLIVGDFRLSLSVSARLAGIPYATVTNAYWSPYYPVAEFPLPVLPISKSLPLWMARQLFRLARPMAFAVHCKPLNRVRLEYSLPSLGSDLRTVYTDADHVLYADVPQLFPTDKLPSSHHFLGPVLWSPPMAFPEWWEKLPADKPIVYLTLGSSGSVPLMRKVLEALADQAVTVIASMAGSDVAQRPSANAYVADYLPGVEAAARSRLVICNGGSPTSQQALASGVPVLGIASNMDQFLNMRAIVDAGAGAVLRADRIDNELVRKTVIEMLTAPRFGEAAKKIARMFEGYDAPGAFAGFVAAVTKENRQSGVSASRT